MIVRWRGRSRRVLGITDLLEDETGARVAESDREGLSVRYPRDRSYVEVHWQGAVAIATREFVAVDVSMVGAQRPLAGSENAIRASFLDLQTPDGPYVWRGETREPLGSPDWAFGSTPIRLGTQPGTLTLPTGEGRRTDTGRGFFSAFDGALVHAAETWRDSDRGEGWAVTTEAAGDDPWLQALPLLFFTHPPTA